ncbi:MAG: penicillin-binding protein activator [Alphaproteobacteria bacterium]|jgi:outer membrane PBP1 activator LpoA protein
MFINKLKNFFYILFTLGVLYSCTSVKPVQIRDATDLDAPIFEIGTTKNIAVLLPESNWGESIKTSIQMAFIQSKSNDINVRFTDLSGSSEEKSQQIKSALLNKPDLIIGPIFSEEVEILRQQINSNIPVLSFSSDTNVLGNGILTMSLIPTQSVETIVRHIITDGKKEIMIITPDNKTGYIMGNAALDAANIYGLDVAGFYYYKPGNMENMKNVSENMAMFNARNNANTRAKEILSDILNKQIISESDKIYVNELLENRKKSDTIGDVPYDAILFLGNASDSKALGSFMRYFDVPAKKVKFYGTAMWDNSEMFRDITMSGASFAAMPAISPEFTNAYRTITDKEPERISTMGYDAAMLAKKALLSGRNVSEFLSDPSGFRGLDGLMRLQANGISERALQIMVLDGSGTPKIIKTSATNFIKPLYQITKQNNNKPNEIKISAGINPMYYLQLPESVRGKYSAKTYRENEYIKSKIEIKSEEITILPEDSSEPIIDPDFQPIELNQVNRTMVDEIEIH